MTRWLHLGYKAARRVVVGVVGGTVVLIGVCMLVLPGPALVVIPIGLAILSIEFAWARRWLHKVKAAADQATARFNGGTGSRNGSGKGPAAGSASDAAEPADRTVAGAEGAAATGAEDRTGATP